MITFLCGLESENKTREFIARVKASADSSRRVTVIVPEQQAVVWERRLAEALEPSSALNLDVVSFTRLANLVERSYGGLSYSLASRAERYLLMWRALQNAAPYLRVYGGDADPGSLASAMQDVQGELERSGVSPEALNDAADAIEADAGKNSLSDRMRDVALISAEYKASFSGDFDDPADECEKLLSLLREHDFFAGRDVFIDSFYSLTAIEGAIVREIFSQADNVTMTFACPAGKVEDAPHLEHIKKFYDLMRSFCDPTVVEIEPGEGDGSRASRERAYLRACLWDFTAKAIGAAEGEPYVRTVSCADRYDEAEYAVCRVEQLVRAGARYSEIAVIAGSADPYLGIIDTAFADAGIPLSVSVRFHLSSSPVVTLALAIVGAIRSRFAREDIIAMLSTGLTSLSDDEIASLSRYTDVWSIDNRRAWNVEEWTMDPDGYTDRRSPRAERELTLANSAKEKVEEILSDMESAFSRNPTVREACRALWNALEKAGAYGKLKKRAAELDALGYRDAADFARAAYGELAKCLDCLVSVLGDEKTDAKNFGVLLRRLIAEQDVGVIPSGIDEVIFGAADRLRADKISHVIILGASDGVFPHTPNESSIFTDSDRVRMEGAGVVLSDDAETRSGAQLFWFWRACTVGERSLDVVWHESDGSDKRGPSTGATRVKALLDAQTLRFSPDDALLSLWTRSAAPRFISAAISAAKDGAAHTESEPEDGHGAERIAEALLSLGISPEAEKHEGEWDRIPSELAERIFGKDLSLSDTRLTNFIKCAFMYYGHYVLGLDERSKNLVSPVNVGDFIHYVLEKFLSSGDVCALSDEQSADLIRRLCEEKAAAVFGADVPPRLRYLLGRIQRNVQLISRMLRREFSVARFKPFAMEQDIGTGDGAVPPPVIDLGEGRSVSLRGKIDRLDVYRRGEDAFVRVVDYKTGDKRLSDRDLDLGLNMQMYLYLFAVCACPDSEFRRKLLGTCQRVRPAGVMYFSAKTGSASSDKYVEGDAAEKAAESSVVRTGRFLDDEDVLRAMDPELQKEFIPVSATSKGYRTDHVLSDEGFDSVRSRVEQKLAEVSLEMLSGRSDALPLDHGGLPCDYCKFRPLCRNVDQTCRYE